MKNSSFVFNCLMPRPGLSGCFFNSATCPGALLIFIFTGSFMKKYLSHFASRIFLLMEKITLQSMFVAVVLNPTSTASSYKVSFWIPRLFNAFRVTSLGSSQPITFFSSMSFYVILKLLPHLPEFYASHNMGYAT